MLTPIELYVLLEIKYKEFLTHQEMRKGTKLFVDMQLAYDDLRKANCITKNFNLTKKGKDIVDSIV